jgi:hypothetical protein
MPKSFTISGIDHIIKMLNQYPQLSGLSSLAPIFEVGHQARLAAAKSKCNCGANKIYRENKHVFENSLVDMANGGDHLVVKNLLNVEQLCYYGTDMSGRRTLKCI